MIEKINGSLILGIAGGIIVIASAIWQWKEKRESDRKAQNAQDSLKSLNQATLTTTRELAESYKSNAILEKSRAEQLIKKANELAESNKENARLQEELKNQVTGGDTKPLLDIVSYKFTEPDFECFVLLFDIENNGKYPLYNIKAVITDMNGFVCAPFIEIKRIGNTFQTGRPTNYNALEWQVNRNVDAGTITPNNRFPLYAATYSNNPKLWQGVFPKDANRNEAHYNVEISWNGGKMTYFLTTIIDNNQFKLEHYSGLFNNKSYDLKNNLVFNVR